MPFTNKVNLEQFLKLYSNDKNRVVPFIGAGLAVPLFPSWKNLLLEMVELCYSNNQLNYDKGEILKRINDGQKYLEIADVCVDAMGKTAYREFLENHFDKKFDYDQIPDAYKELFKLELSTLITTNYDSIPEVASRGTYKIYNNKTISEALRAYEQRKNLVVKLHGDINNQDSIVLTNQEYNGIIFNNSAVQNFLRTIFSSKTLLFLGFSLTDIHIDLILKHLHSINDGISITHYALMAISSKFDIDTIEKNYGIKVIPYTPADDKHPEVLEFIKMLADAKLLPSLPNLQKLNTICEISNHLGETLKTLIGSRSFAVTYERNEQCIYISYLTRAITEYELQKEIVNISKSINFETTIVKQIIILTQEKSETEIDYDKSFPVILGSSFSYSMVLDFINGKIGEADFWAKIYFFRPIKVGTFMKQMIPITLPHIGGN